MRIFERLRKLFLFVAVGLIQEAISACFIYGRFLADVGGTLCVDFCGFQCKFQSIKIRWAENDSVLLS